MPRDMRSVEELEQDVFRVPGVTLEELNSALALLAAAEEVRADEAAMRRNDLVRAMVVAGIDPVPRGTVEQAFRLAELRERLITSGALTIDALCQIRGDNSEAATRTWVSRRRNERALFSVEHNGAVLIPAFQLTGHGEIRPHLDAPLRVLLQAELGGWELWAWFASGSPWLGGRAPEELLDKDIEAVASAAQAFVSNLA